jgi:hypothetical protein
VNLRKFDPSEQFGVDLTVVLKQLGCNNARERPEVRVDESRSAVINDN